MDYKAIAMESIGWLSTGLFLFSILVPNRKHLHLLGLFAAVTTGIYAYYHGATAILGEMVYCVFLSWIYIFKKRTRGT